MLMYVRVCACSYYFTYFFKKGDGFLGDPRTVSIHMPCSYGLLIWRQAILHHHLCTPCALVCRTLSRINLWPLSFCSFLSSCIPRQPYFVPHSDILRLFSASAIWFSLGRPGVGEWICSVAHAIRCNTEVIEPDISQYLLWQRQGTRAALVFWGTENQFVKNGEGIHLASGLGAGGLQGSESSLPLLGCLANWLLLQVSTQGQQNLLCSSWGHPESSTGFHGGDHLSTSLSIYLSPVPIIVLVTSRALNICQ